MWALMLAQDPIGKTGEVGKTLLKSVLKENIYA